MLHYELRYAKPSHRLTVSITQTQKHNHVVCQCTIIKYNAISEPLYQFPFVFTDPVYRCKTRIRSPAFVLDDAPLLIVSQ